MTLQQRECLCALACREAMREWRAGQIGNQELIWRTWQAQQRYRVGEVCGDDSIRGLLEIEAVGSACDRA